MKNKYKYSIVIPVRNGLSNLKISLPHLLNISSKRNDVEIILFNNNSSDDIEIFCKKFSEKFHFFKYYSSRKDLKAGNSLNAALKYANGDYISYMGDDDQIIYDRFDLLDDYLIRYNNPDIILGNFIRCEIDENQFVRSLDLNSSSKEVLFDTQKLRYEYLEKLSIYCGGSFTIKKNIYSGILRKFKYYSSPQGVEFFIFRSSLFFAKNILITNYPLFLMGRSKTSVGKIAFDNNGKNNRLLRWNDKFEFENALPYSFFQYNGYVPISLDPVLRIISVLNIQFNINIFKWTRYAIADLFSLYKKNKIKFIELLKVIFRSSINFYYKLYGLAYLVYIFIITQKSSNRGFEKSLTFTDNFTINDISNKYKDFLK